MTSRNKWILISTLILAIGVIGFFLRNDLPGTSNERRSDTLQNGSEKRIQHQSANDGRDSGSRAERERIAKHNEMLERLSKEASAAAQKSFAASRSSPPPIIPLTSGGDLNPSVIESLSLSASEVESLKSAISETRSKEAKMFAERAELLPGSGEQDGTPFKYLVRAKRDRGAAEMKQLAEKVGQIIDGPRSKQFMGGIGEFDFYGGFGKYDVEMTLYSEKDVEMVKIQYLDPASGKPTRFGAGRLDNPNYSSWKALDLPKP